MKRKPSGFRIQSSGGETVRRSTLDARRSGTLNFSVRRSASSVQHASSRRGATLLVTLGVLTVLSIMVVTFLLSARYHSLSAKHFSDKTVARQALGFALAEAMQSIDDAMIASNFVANSNSLSDTEKSKRRVYPLKLWQAINDTSTFNQRPNQNSGTFLLPVPGSTSAATNNLLNSEVGRLLPAALTNWISPNNLTLGLCGGWTNFTAETRVSYAIFNCSGFIDAHCYDFTNNVLTGTTQPVSRAYFSQQDLLGDTQNGRVHAQVQKFTADPGQAALNPFFIASHDSDPHAMPLATNGVQTADAFGTRSFAPPPKFDINSITNYFLALDTLGVKKRLAVMPRSWFNNVTRLLQSASISNLNDQASFGGRDAYFGDPQKTAWNIVNYMTESRIPTAFPDNAFESNTASRLDYAIEAVPLINEVELKDVFAGTGATYKDSIDDSLYDAALYRIDQEIRAPFESMDPKPTVNIKWSNIYAFDVELWYPFKTNAVPKNTYLWLSVTTNFPSAFVSTQFPYGWLNDTYDTLGYTLFYQWNGLFVSTNTDTTVTNDVAWSFIQTNVVLLTYINNPTAFNSASNQAEIADAFSSLWQLTWLSGIQFETNYPSDTYTYQLLHTTLPYTNRITQAVLSNSLSGVTAVLNSPYSGVDWSDASAVAQYFKELFKTSASQFSEYEKHDVSARYGPNPVAADNEYQVFYVTNQLAYQPYIVTNTGTGGGTITIGFKPLSGETGGANDFHTWLRPMVTVSEINLDGSLGTDVGIPETVDEALLIHNGDKDTGYYKRWDKPGSTSIDDPRDNAWYDPNQTGNKGWKDYADGAATMGEKNRNCDVAEYPFIHYDRPFLSIGELGYINVDLTNRFSDLFQFLPHSFSKDKPRDTIDFSTRSGASLLDKFCIGGVSNVTRGLVQANATHGEVISRVLNQITTGWPTGPDGQTSGDTFQLNDAHTQTWVDHWTNTLLRGYSTSATTESENSGLAGWNSFADMLPDLSTNAFIHNVNPLPSEASSGPGIYDYTEDVMRGIIDKVSFRQNIFVVIVAAQTLSPASTDANPIVLADQRAAVTVIRDAYTGRWMIYNWTWLTE